MECTTEVEYISIYDKPKRGKGRPRGSEFSVEEQRQKHIDANSRCYYNNHEYYTLQKRSYKQAMSEAKQINLRKPFFWIFDTKLKMPSF